MRQQHGYHNINPVYKHNLEPSKKLSENSVVRDNDLHKDNGNLPSNIFLAPNQPPVTLQQAIKRPQLHKMNGYRRPIGPDMKQRPDKTRRPSNHKNTHGPPMRNPNVPNVPPSIQYKNRHIYKNGRPGLVVGNRHEQAAIIGSIARPVQPQLPKFFTPVNIPKPIVYNQHQTILRHQQKEPQSGAILGKPMASKPIETAEQVNTGVFDTEDTINFGQSNVIGVHVVKSQIRLPPIHDHPSDHIDMNYSLNSKGQIILGKPMENPIPMDQQMIQTNHKATSVASIHTKLPNVENTVVRIHEEHIEPGVSSFEIKSSDFMGQSAEPSMLADPAVNTGFKPDSIVVESGFKPIIREPLMANEDRITDYLHEASVSADRRDDSDLIADYEEPLRSDRQRENQAEHKHMQLHFQNVEYRPITHTFLPMFIPSPLDYNMSDENETSQQPMKTNSENLQEDAVNDQRYKNFTNKDVTKKETMNHAHKNNTKNKLFPNIQENSERYPYKSKDETKNFFPKNHAKEDRPQPVYKEDYNPISSKINLNKNDSQDAIKENTLSPHQNNRKQITNLNSDIIYTTTDGNTLKDVFSESINHLPKLLQVGQHKGARSDVDKKGAQNRKQDSKRITNLKLTNTQLDRKDSKDKIVAGETIKVLHKLHNKEKDYGEAELGEGGDSKEIYKFIKKVMGD